MSVLNIELVWVEKYGKMGEKPHFLGNFEGGTGTKQSGTGTISVLSTSTGTGTQCSISYQCSYFSHNLVISYPL